LALIALETHIAEARATLSDDYVCQ
jgi:hypothetical protein